MDAQVIAGQYVQRGVVRQGKAKPLRIVSILMNSREFVGTGVFDLMRVAGSEFVILP